MQFKERDPKKKVLPPEQPLEPPPGAEPAAGATDAPPTPPGGVLVHHGIHQGQFPVAGQTVAQARRILAPMMNIDPEAVAVIGGQIVEDEDERVITESAQMLSFVKRSSVKGIGLPQSQLSELERAMKELAKLELAKPELADARRARARREAEALTQVDLPLDAVADGNLDAKEHLVLCNGTAQMCVPGATPKVLRTTDVIEVIQDESVLGFDEDPIPPATRWHVRCGALQVLILELNPGVRRMSWIHPDSPEPYGPEAVYRPVAVATPYVVLKVVFARGRLQPLCELFYRNEPLRSLDDTLYWPNLLNVSPGSYECIAWLCTQYLLKELRQQQVRLKKRKLTAGEQVEALTTHLWGGGFNLSSDVHEGNSCFAQAKEHGIDARVTDVDRWVAATAEQWDFVLDVEWKSTKWSVRKLIERELERAGLPRDFSNTGELLSALQSRRPRRPRKRATATPSDPVAPTAHETPTSNAQNGGDE